MRLSSKEGTRAREKLEYASGASLGTKDFLIHFVTGQLLSCPALPMDAYASRGAAAGQLGPQPSSELGFVTGAGSLAGLLHELLHIAKFVGAALYLCQMKL